jgi:large subunit ribosomal protein L19
MDYIRLIEQEQLKHDLPNIAIGDYVKVHLKVKEGNRERIQIFEGTIIARKGCGLRESITVRRISYGVGVERVLPLHSPKINKIDIVRRGKIRRAKLYYLRDRVGKAARVKERLEPKGAKRAHRLLAEAAAAAAAAEAEAVRLAEEAEKAEAEAKAAEEAAIAAAAEAKAKAADEAAKAAAAEAEKAKAAEMVAEDTADVTAEAANDEPNAVGEAAKTGEDS